MNPNSKEFKKLQKTWYEKIKTIDPEWEDIEQDDENLKSWHSYYFRRRSDGSTYSAPAKTEYYRVAGHFLHDYKFENEIDKEIWKLHSDGIPIEEILNILNVRNKRQKKILNNLRKEIRDQKNILRLLDREKKKQENRLNRIYKKKQKQFYSKINKRSVHETIQKLYKELIKKCRNQE